MIESFKTVPLFQVYFRGLGTKLWTLDAKLDHGALCVKTMLCKKIRALTRQAFAETLTPSAYATLKAWFDTTGVAYRDWMKITEDFGV